MAQWNGQFTGRTHETKVARIEDTMWVAVKSLFAASKEKDYEQKRSTVEKVANRLLSARLKMLGARIARLTEVRSPDEYSPQVKILMARESATSKGGVAAILKEFGVR